MKELTGVLIGVLTLVLLSGMLILDGRTYKQCEFLDVLREVKNTVDTIRVKASYQGLGKPDKVVLKKLESEKKLKVKDFTTSIDFQPEHCSTTFYAPCREGRILDSLYAYPLGARLELTCIVYKNYPEGNRPFFVVDKVRIE